jgi:FkbM family methyltransferase
MKGFITRILFACKVLSRKQQEPFFKWKYIFRYIKNGYFFPSYTKQNFKRKIHVTEIEGTKYVDYNGMHINYPKAWNNRLIVENFNNIINEQTAIGSNVNPHKYISNEQLKPDWVIYDLGAAEGSQSKFWVNQVRQIVLFEPAPSFYEQLKKTFHFELSTNKVIIINAGITNKESFQTIEGQAIEFNTLEALIKKYKLPPPDYIKADIEGEELSFLETSVDLLQKNTVSLIEITVYHRPQDYLTIPAFFKQFNGTGYFSEGVMVFNRDGLVDGYYSKKIYTPVIRKCLYTFEFS